MHKDYRDYYIEILTPIHIGNDMQLSPMMFHHEDKDINIYDVNDVAEQITDVRRVLEMKNPRQIALSDLIPPEKLRRIKPIKKIRYWGDAKNISNQEVELLIHERHENYLPGSSLKGSILHAVEFKHLALKRENRNGFEEIIRTFQSSFAVSDCYFETMESAIQKGLRITSAHKQGKSPTQQQDNYKEWLMTGKSEPLNAYHRKPSDESILPAIHAFTEKYLAYQSSYFDYLLKHIDFSHFPFPIEDIEETHENVKRLMTLNTQEEPILILGRNTHRYSKSNELFDRVRYEKTPGKNKEHPVSRLLVYDAKDYLTIPGMARIKKR